MRCYCGCCIVGLIIRSLVLLLFVVVAFIPFRSFSHRGKVEIGFRVAVVVVVVVVVAPLLPRVYDPAVSSTHPKDTSPLLWRFFFVLFFMLLLFVCFRFRLHPPVVGSLSSTGFERFENGFLFSRC